MSAMASDPDRKLRLTRMDTALRLGADAVSLQVNFDGTNDAHNLELIGDIVDEAQPCGLPVLAMVYDTRKQQDGDPVKRYRHLMRIAVELGVDAIKIAPPTDVAHVPALLRGLAGDVAIFFAGGSVQSEDALLALARAAAVNGAAGMCVGRNVFQRERPAELLTEVRRVFEEVELSACQRVLPSALVARAS